MMTKVEKRRPEMVTAGCREHRKDLTIVKMHMIFECDKCGKKSSNEDEIMECEASHLGLTVEEMKEWERLKEDAKDKGAIVSSFKNETTDRDFDEAIRRVLEFEKEHGIKG